MVVERTIVGVLVAGALAPRDFSPDDTSLLGLAADRAAIAIENARLYRKAEERGQAARVLGYVADGVFLVDAKGAVQLWNPAAEAITGVPAEAVLGRPLEEVIPGWEDARASRQHRERSGCVHWSCDDASRRDPRS